MEQKTQIINSKSQIPNCKLQIANLKSEKGMALVMALILSLISLSIVSALIYFVTQGTVISGFQKRYYTAQEAGKGGIEFFTEEIVPKTIDGTGLSTLGSYGGLITGQTTNACFSTKLTQITASWGGCSSSLDPKDTPDVTFTLTGVAPQPDFNVYAKIVDTIPGNSDISGLELEGLGVVESGSGLVTPKSIPYLYRIEVQSERTASPDEQANFTAVFAY